MNERTPFPPVFWVANLIEVLERFAYYGIYFGFGIYMASLGYSMGQLGVIQFFFLLLSYVIPLFSGTFADRYGFKGVLMVSYVAYLPPILMLILTKSFSGILLTMMFISFAAGIFKPLISGTVRATTDRTNTTLGFGIFYAMVNVGGSLGPIVAGKLRAISWDYAFYAAAAAIALMMLITIFFYKEPERERGTASLKDKLREIAVALSDIKFAVFLLLLGVFFWIPFWGFFSVCAVYVDRSIDTAQLYENLRVFGTGFANFFSHEEEGVRKVLGETISHTGYIIMVFQVFVSRYFERFRAYSSFLFGLFVSAVGFVILGLANVATTWFVFLGIFVFAVGEMISSPRIQEYITWIAPKEKAGLYMGSNFLAVAVGSVATLTYTPLYGYFDKMGHAEYVWYLLAAHMIVGIVVLGLFAKVAGEFKEASE